MPNRIRARTSPPLRGAVRVPGDKSVSHRAVLLAGIASGTSRVRGFLDGADCRATIGVVRSLGVEIDEVSPDELVIHGRGLHGLTPPDGPLDCANSGTTMRLLAGLTAAQRFDTILVGTEQLSGRPMARIIAPLAEMGAQIGSDEGTAPLTVTGGRPLSGVEYAMPVASAQLKSCLLLAGLYASGTTTLVEKGPSRDHTERMLAAMGAHVTTAYPRVALAPPAELDPFDIAVPGDISSAAFLLVAAAVVPGSELTLEGVGINPTRLGIVSALEKMGAEISLENERLEGREPVADIAVRHGALRGADFGGDEIVTMIDEIPVLAVAAAAARGTTTIRDARELRVKETDRIATTAKELSRLGARVTPLDDGMTIEGGAPLAGAEVSSRGDHRLAMLLAVAGLHAAGETVVRGAEVTADSFPGFEGCLAGLGAPIEVAR